MNRIEFMHCLDLEDQNFATLVINSFDKFMALYFPNKNIILHSKQIICFINEEAMRS